MRSYISWVKSFWLITLLLSAPELALSRDITVSFTSPDGERAIEVNSDQDGVKVALRTKSNFNDAPKPLWQGKYEDGIREDYSANWSNDSKFFAVAIERHKTSELTFYNAETAKRGLVFPDDLLQSPQGAEKILSSLKDSSLEIGRVDLYSFNIEWLSPGLARVRHSGVASAGIDGQVSFSFTYFVDLKKMEAHLDEWSVSDLNGKVLKKVKVKR